MSRKPRVVISAQRAPRRSITALVAIAGAVQDLVEIGPA